MVQVAQAFEHPGSRRRERTRQALEEVSRTPWSADSAGRTNANRALRSGFSMRASCSSRMLLPRRPLAHRQLQRERDVVRFRQGQARDVLGLSPDPLEPADRARISATSRSAENHADFRLGVGAAARPVCSTCSIRGETPRASVRRETSSTPVAHSRQDSLHVLFVCLARQRAQREIDNVRGRRPAIEHLFPECDPGAPARERIVDVRKMRQR